LTAANQVHHFGGLAIRSTKQVLELDPNPTSPVVHSHAPKVSGIAGNEARKVFFCSSCLFEILSSMIIVVSCKDEALDVIKGTLSGIPNPCLIIFLSNSSLDGFGEEVRTVTEFCKATRREAIILYQKDAGLGRSSETLRLSKTWNHRSPA
jgi:mannosyl-3-phosphoglycerate synthase